VKILVACIHYPVASGRYISDAFERLGHDVRHIGDCARNQIWGIQVDKKYNWYPHGNLNKSWSDWKPDVVIVAESAFQYHHPYYTDVPHLVWGLDNHVRDYRQAGIDRYFLAHRNVSVMEWGEDCTWLPCGYDPVWFKPSPINWHERPYDIAMIGVMYPERVAIIEAMQKAGLNVYATTGLLYEEYRNVYWQSKIALCSSAAGDLAQRIFECGAMGCTVLTDRLYDLDNPYTNERLGLKGWASYNGVEQAVAQAVELTRDNPDLGAFGAFQMMQTCQPHTWDARAQLVLNYLEGRPYQLERFTSQTGMVKVKSFGGEGMLIG
jgi:hypothetical protein